MGTMCHRHRTLSQPNQASLSLPGFSIPPSPCALSQDEGGRARPWGSKGREVMGKHRRPRNNRKGLNHKAWANPGKESGNPALLTCEPFKQKREKRPDLKRKMRLRVGNRKLCSGAAGDQDPLATGTDESLCSAKLHIPTTAHAKGGGMRCQWEIKETKEDFFSAC